LIVSLDELGGLLSAPKKKGSTTGSITSGLCLELKKKNGLY